MDFLVEYDFICKTIPMDFSQEFRETMNKQERERENILTLREDAICKIYNDNVPKDRRENLILIEHTKYQMALLDLKLNHAKRMTEIIQKRDKS